MRIAVAILTWNRAAKLAEALESVRAQTRPPDEIVVVDSASSDDTCSMLRQRFPKVRLVRLHRNLGCPEGRNIALANCTAEIIYSLDDDGQLHPRCLEVIEQTFAERPQAGIVASKVVLALHPSPEYVANQLAKLPRRTIRFSGGASAIRRRVLEKAGYYPSDFWRQSEEADLLLRTLDAGFEIWYAPAAVMFHLPNVSDNSSVIYYATLNSLRSVIRLYPARYVPLKLIQKIAGFAVLSVRVGNSFGVAASVAYWALSVPVLLCQRQPVRVETLRRLMQGNKEYLDYLKTHVAACPLDKAT